MPSCSIHPALPAPLAATALSLAGRARSSSCSHSNRTSFDPLQPAPLRAEAGQQRQRICLSVQSALTAVEPFRLPLERRREARQPYPYPIHLTPLDSNEQPEVDRTFVVIGKHLAPHGLDFYFSQPLAERRVIASLDCGAEGWIGLVVELDWCRFSRHGWYDNGGRFIAVVASPLLELDGRPRAA